MNNYFISLLITIIAPAYIGLPLLLIEFAREQANIIGESQQMKTGTMILIK